jgi:hypothetical protein
LQDFLQRLANLNRERNETENKDNQSYSGDYLSGEIERRVVERFGMTNAQHHGKQNGE